MVDFSVGGRHRGRRHPSTWDTESTLSLRRLIPGDELGIHRLHGRGITTPMSSHTDSHRWHPAWLWPQPLWRAAPHLPLPSHNHSGLGPTEPCTGCNRFLLSSGCGWGKYYRVAHSTGLIPNETQIPCRTPAACLERHHATTVGSAGRPVLSQRIAKRRATKAQARKHMRAALNQSVHAHDKRDTMCAVEQSADPAPFPCKLLSLPLSRTAQPWWPLRRGCGVCAALLPQQRAAAAECACTWARRPPRGGTAD